MIRLLGIDRINDIINELDSEYAIFNESFIDEDKFSKVLELFVKLINSKDENIKKEIDELLGDYRGFFHTKTIYKVKNNG